MPIDLATDHARAVETIAARRAYIADQAPCTQCRMALSACREEHGPGGPSYDRTFPGCCCFHGKHVPSVTAALDLANEVITGQVRTVAEVLAVLNDRPRQASMHWLLWQREWWQPKTGPMIRITDMTDTHRLHLSGWLLRRAEAIVAAEQWSLLGGLQPSGDMACDAFDAMGDAMRRDPEGFVRETELWQALTADLPSVDGKRKERQRFKNLALRAAHWSTCPANRDLAAECDCETGRVAQIAGEAR